MDAVDDQQPSYKHHCRVCRKGFMCGRALGGHMRAHGIGDESAYLDDDDDDRINDWEDGRPTNKRMYQLRTNPNRLKSCRNCEHCGKEFSSWKSFLEHGKCSFDDVSESPVSSHESDEEYYNEKCTTGWLKRKRTLRAKVSPNYSTTEEEEEDLLIAACLLQLANPVVNPPIVEQDESCASASREEERRNPAFFFGMSSATFARPKVLPNPTPKGLFECKACKRVFTSHQALGGHRASHKKVKGCYAAKLDQHDDDQSFGLEDVVTHEEFFPSKPTPSFQYTHGTSLSGAAKRKTKVHECSICHRVFSSGQALGGHKRCHWIVNNAPEPSPISRFHYLGNIDKSVHQLDTDKPRTKKSELLDLNVPAWVHLSGVRRDPHNPLSFDVSTEPHVDPWTCNEAETIIKLAIPSGNT